MRQARAVGVVLLGVLIAGTLYGVSLLAGPGGEPAPGRLGQVVVDAVHEALERFARPQTGERVTVDSGEPKEAAEVEKPDPGEVSPEPEPQETKNDPTDDPIVQKAREIAGGYEGSLRALELIYDWVTHNIGYDVETYLSGEIPRPDPYRTLATRKGLCGDYALLTKALLSAVGVEAELKSGTVEGESGQEQHAWNLARIDGVAYALDTTWGAGYVDREGGAFVSRPTRLYLTDPQELSRLHADREYRLDRMKDHLRKAALSSPISDLHSLENLTVSAINEARFGAGVPQLEISGSLREAARAEALRISDLICRDLEWSLDPGSPGPEIRTAIWLVRSWWGDGDQGGGVDSYLAQPEVREAVLSPEFRLIGAAAIARGELTVLLLVLGG